MKKILFLAGALLMSTMVSCSSASTGESTTDQNDSTSATRAVEVLNASTLDEFKTEWQACKLTVPDNDNMFKAAVTAFGKAFPAFAPNAALVEHFENEGADNDDFIIDDESDNKFIKAMSATQFVSSTGIKMWRLRDGQMLLGIVMTEAHEDGTAQCVPAFYSLDTSNGVLTPQPAIAQKINDTVAGYDMVNINFSPDDDNIEVLQFTKSGEDSYDVTDHHFVFNGTDFDFTE